MFKILPLLVSMVVPQGEPSPKEFEEALLLPEIGHHELRIITPHLVELYLVNTQDPPGGWDATQRPLKMLPPLTTPQWWDFLDGEGPKADAPNKDSFQVLVDEQTRAVERVGFRRRAIHAHKEGQELRVGQSIYLLMGNPIAEGAQVSVTDAPGAEIKHLEGFTFEAGALANRYNPAIHVNQVGYGATWPDQEDGGSKKAHLSYFLGDLGRAYVDETTRQWMLAPVSLEDGLLTDQGIPLGLSLDTPFEIIDAESHAVVFRPEGDAYTPRDDSRWATYTDVLEMDFSALTTPGLYRLRIPGLGASMPFTIGDEMPAMLARTLALGLYHQRSGADHTLPYTRFVDPPGHVAPATIPFDERHYPWPYRNVRGSSNQIFTAFGSYAKHPAPQIRSQESMLFPYVGDVVAWWPMDGNEVVLEEDVIAGFNSFSYEESTLSDPFEGHPAGHAFGERPARSAYPGRQASDTQTAITGQQNWRSSDGVSFGELDKFQGVGFINTYQIYEPVEGGADSTPSETRATGVLDIPEFVIEKPWIGFLIGGSDQPYDLDSGGQQTGVTAVNLLINGTPVRTMTGHNRNAMEWRYWDVTPWTGQTATLQIIDSSQTGFLLVDEIMQTTRTQLRDISATRQSAELINGPAFTERESEAQLGQSLAFDGVDDHAIAHSLELLNGNKTMTISTWVKIESRDRDQVVFAKGPAEDPDSGFALTFEATSKTLQWRVGSAIATSSRIINNGNWHFVAATFEAGEAQGLQLWVDDPDTLGTASTTSLPEIPNGVAPLIIGNESSLPSETYLHGGLDDLRIRSSVVSTEELLEASVGTGPWIDVSRGHFDAGDYGKYMINSALALHALIFTADAILQLPGNSEGPDPLDNLGIPESGDGIADVLQEAKWEADYIAKMQDTDGGFFFIVHPRNRSFEGNVLPSEGDRQVVWPKTLSATGSGVAALVETASSPSFQRHFPDAAARYMEAGMRGWEFIESAVAKYGVVGAHQRITHYGNLAESRDEIAWAASALFAATGESTYEARMKEWMPWDTATLHGNPFAWREFRRFTWQKLNEAAGCAMRTYIFANRGARAGRSISYDDSLVGPKSYREHVIDELLGGADDLVTWAEDNPFRSSIPSEAKRFGSVTYYFAIADGFDLIAAHLLEPKQEYFDTMLNGLNYPLGSNPLNRSFVSGIGWAQTREYVSQFAENDERQLPPIGFTMGSVNTGVPWLQEFQGLLGLQNYPPDADESVFATPYGVYDRPFDVWDVSNEFVIPIHAEAFATSAYLFSLTDAYQEPWTPAPAVEITGTPESAEVGGTYALAAVSSDADLNQGRLIWEAPSHEIGLTPNYSVSTNIAREGWTELEVLWPDGKRSFTRSEFAVNEKISQNVEQYQPTAEEPGEGPYGNITGNRNVRLYYPFDSDFKDAMGVVQRQQGAAEDVYDLRTGGSPEFDNGFFQWPGYESTRPDFRALKIDGAKDLLQTQGGTLLAEKLFPPHTKWISVESIVFVDGFDENLGPSYFFGLDIEGLARPIRLWLYKDPWKGPITGIYGQTQLTNVNDLIPLKQWLHVRALMNEEHTTLYLDGQQIDQVPTEAFDQWLNPTSRIKILTGGFKGFVSDLIIKAGTGAEETLNETVPPPLSGFYEWQDWRFFDQPSEARLPDADPDGDGRNNLLEYAVGSEPQQADMSPPLALVTQDDGRLSLRYRRPINRPDITYRFQHSQDLVAWNTFEPALEPTTLDEEGAFLTLNFDNAELQPNQQLQHLRLAVTLNN